MATSKKSEAASAHKNSQSASAREMRAVAIPRAWVAALVALIVVPWLIVGAIYLLKSEEASDSPSSTQSGAETSSQPEAGGPWGRLATTPILISPPLELIADDWGRGGMPHDWYFPGITRELLEAFLLTAGMSGEDTTRVLSAARSDPRTGGLVVKPDPDLVRTLKPEVRGHLYLQLAKSSLNFDQANAFKFHGASADQWLMGSLISPSTRQLLEPLIYRDEHYLLFADAELIRSQIDDIEEQRRLAKTLLRQKTMLVRLLVDDLSEVDELAEYWGRGGRRTDLRPLLESVAGSGSSRLIDIVHLLPAMARNHLYRYPRITTADLNKSMLSNCLWTALNFFREKPDDRYLDVNQALKSLQQDYYVVESGFQLGDIIAFINEEGNLFHAAVFLADDLVFSKNGTSPVAPWTIVTIDQVKGYYRSRSSNPRLIYHRRNDL